MMFTSLSDSRRIVLILSIIGVTISLIVFFNADKYITIVLSFAAMSLSLFHAILSLWTSVSERSLKAIDYPYLILIGAGLFLGISSSNVDRYKARHAFLLEASNEASQQINLQRRLCREVNSRTDKLSTNRIPVIRLFVDVKLRVRGDYCKWLEDVESANIDNDNERLKELLMYGKDFYYADQRDFLQALFPIISKSFRGFQDLFDETLIQVLARNAFSGIEGIVLKNQSEIDIEAIQSSLNNEVVNYVRLWVWPFLLCLGLAMRLTRVTADVMGWPEKKS